MHRMLLMYKKKQSTFAVCCPDIIVVDKPQYSGALSTARALYIFFLFSAFCTIHMRSGVFVTSVIGCLATISSPCISIRYWSFVIAIASSAVLGHRKEPLSSLLYRRRNPSPSHRSTLILSFLLPQKRKIVFLSYGSSVYWKRTMDARPSIPRRRSVKPHYPNIRIMWMFSRPDISPNTETPSEAEKLLKPAPGQHHYRYGLKIPKWWSQL